LCFNYNADYNKSGVSFQIPPLEITAKTQKNIPFTPPGTCFYRPTKDFLFFGPPPYLFIAGLLAAEKP
jgi:hypothetical protein